LLHALRHRRWVLGNRDMKDMAAARWTQPGSGMTKAGKILGIISVVLVCRQSSPGRMPPRHRAARPCRVLRQGPLSAAPSMIRAEGVTRRLGSALAVDGVSFRVGEGEIAGLLGPNGAGKSTLLRMLATYLAPDAGTIEVLGHDAAREPLLVRRAIGYMPEHNALFESMRALELLDFVGRVRGLAGADLAAARAKVVERCGLEEIAGKRVRECSKGYRQRLGLAAALIHDPPSSCSTSRRTASTRCRSPRSAGSSRSCAPGARSSSRATSWPRSRRSRRASSRCTPAASSSTAR
jgi:ABC-type transport system involved in cytochrome c biogenesis ATPase subunit